MDCKKALSRAAALCNRSEQCENDVRLKLTTWLDDITQADDIIKKLKNEGFINEQRYANAYVHDKFNYNGWGRIKLRAKLRGKHVSDSAINSALEQLDEDAYRHMLMHLLTGKWRIVTGQEAQRARAALLRYGASRGFEADLCYQCIAEITGHYDWDD